MPSISEAIAIAIEHHRAGRLDVAEEIYRRVLAAEPDNVDALHLMGMVADQRGAHAVAVDYIRRALALEPGAAVAHNNLGNALVALDRCDEAIGCYRRALELKPEYAEALNNLGTVLQRQKKLDEAIACYRKAIEWSPGYVDAMNNLALALQEVGALEESLRWCRRADELRPNDPRTLLNLGNACLQLEEWELAMAAYQRVSAISPDLPLAESHLALALRGLGRLTEAVEHHRRAVERAPDDASGWNNLGVAQQQAGQLAEAIASFRRAIGCRPDYAEAHSNLLLALEYGPEVSQAERSAAYDDFDRRHVAPLEHKRQPHKNLRDPERALRLGFLGADFRHHPVGYSFLRVLECLRAEDCWIACYANRLYEKDAFTLRFESAAHLWRDVRTLSDDALAEQIRDDGIDVLFDLCGHFAGTRLLTFARKPAPIQIAWTGPTGVSAIDYLLADRRLVPPGAEDRYRERVIRMPDAYTCFVPPPEAPEVGPLPARREGHVTFGTLNNLAKIGPAVIDTWATILRRTPGARLLLRHLNSSGNEQDCRRVRDAFAQAGLDPSRVEVVGRATFHERLALYQRIDVALDPFPFSGATTTYESLWMGVPVVTLPGDSYYRRMSATHLAGAGLEELVASSLSEYVDTAVALAGDLPRLAALRAGLRPRLAASPLYDGPRFARNLMQILRDVWRQWCQTPSS